MVKLKIDNIEIQAKEGMTILEAARQAGVHIPTLCYLKDLNEIGACRVCMVELVGNEKLITACNNNVVEGMEIYTNSPKVRTTRKTNVSLLLSQHDCHCPTCARSGNCSLQTLSNDLGILSMPFGKTLPKNKWPKDFPLVKDANKCIKCMRCVQVCDKVQGLNVWDISGTGSRTTVDVSGNMDITQSDCSLCGQCITHCPVGALRERDDTDKFFDALGDPDKITVVQIAPAIRAAWGEGLGLTKKFATVKRLVGALKKLGANYVFDTDFAADMTIMEEGSEFLKIYTDKQKQKYPLFTSCCPGWVRFMKAQYPQMAQYLSTAKSPQQMFGAITKSYYAELLNVDPQKIFSVSIMPCLAKKAEAALGCIDSAGAGRDVDVVLTTREIARMIKADHIKAEELKEVEFDSPLGIGTGAGVIFGVTGGVMEAALRSAYYLATGSNPDADAFKNVRGMNGWKEADFMINDNKVKVAVVSGLGNARKLMDAIVNGEVSYDFVEVMACPGGCVGGGGQPIHDGKECADERGEILYGLDKVNNLRFSHENPSVVKCYETYLQKPLSHRAHELLHTDHSAWKMPNEKK